MVVDRFRVGAIGALSVVRKVNGPYADAEMLEWARRITEAQVDLNRVRNSRRQLIKRFQRFETVEEIPPSRSATLIGVNTALEAAGIEFISTRQDGPGIRLRPSKANSK